jgi:uncharacterized membrane protein (DUF441 family)
VAIDFNYGRRTGVTTFKKIIQEFCENLAKYQGFITAWIAGSGLTVAQQTQLTNLIAAVNAACDASKQLPDD